jgi:radical SAM superfamily enzyme YgiQ (UPF0313 family)
VKKKIYLIQPSYRDRNGILLKGRFLYIVSLALPALSATIPRDWEKQVCNEYFEDVDFNSDASVIGISSMGYEIFRGIEIAQEFKKRGKTVVFGGFQSHLSTDYLAPHCDSIVHGNPGIQAMAMILRDASDGTLQREYFCGVDVNYPVDYSVLDTRKLLFTPVYASVGCNYRCDYCCIASIYKGGYKLRKLQLVTTELEYLQRRTRRIAFIDTNINGNPAYLKALCEMMIARKFRFVWGAQSTIDIGSDPATLALLRKAGCKALFIGLETIEQANLDAMHKAATTAEYEEKIRNIHRAGIKIAAFLMYGLDSDTVDTAADLSAYIIKQKIALPMINILVPTPGSVLYERLKTEGRVLIKDELDFLKNNLAYNSSFNLCFYLPKRMTPMDVENGFIDLLRRLSGFWQILRRSLSWDLPLSGFFLYSNWMFRKEYIRLKKQKRALHHPIV